ncbi:MAG TPA: NEW3 domain-containing protein, partial [Streptosporangiaceae bacterium]|nr:NEW3 domain-containing protein [Streptosporangiaceae bacterium]
MRRLIRAIVAGLVAVPLAVVAATSAATPAHAEDNGVGQTPALGWSSWSFIRSDPTAAKIEAQARAMKSSGLASVGYQYVNVDDFWYVCPGSQGPAVDQYGRWAIDTSKFPSQSTSTGSENGIQAVAGYVHKLGLKFGLYVTPGISKQAVAQNTPIEGTSYTADQIAEPSTSENNYNCGGMVGIDYSKPGAQQFINSWADQFASWGVDYVKIDGVGSFDVPDVQAWSNGLRQTGRPIHLELSNSLNINDAATWKQYANGWRTGGDVECYCGTNGSSYPLTDWNNVSSRFDTVAAWQPYGGPGAFNDYDSLEVGNGSNDGLTYPERQSQLALWALASSPLILGTDLTNLDQSDLALLKNRSVIAVDQDSIDASRLVDGSTEQIFAKTEKNGDVVAGLFNTASTPQVISTTAATLKATSAADYKVSNLWTGKTTETTGTISAAVPAHGVALVRVTPTRNPAAAPPAATLNLTGLTSLTSGQPATATETFTDNGPLPAPLVRLGLQVPSGWTVTATSPASFLLVGAGKTVHATFKVTAPPPAGLFQTSTVTGTARFAWPGQPQSLS